MCFFIIGNLSVIISVMFPNDFFHPYHVIPPAELFPALMKMRHLCVAKTFMETDAVEGEVFVFRLDIRDAGIHVEYAP